MAIKLIEEGIKALTVFGETLFFASSLRHWAKKGRDRRRGPFNDNLVFPTTLSPDECLQFRSSLLL